MLHDLYRKQRLPQKAMEGQFLLAYRLEEWKGLEKPSGFTGDPRGAGSHGSKAARCISWTAITATALALYIR